MKLGVLTILTLGLFVAAGKPAEEDAKGDKGKLQGTWQVVSLEEGGEKLPAEFSKHFTFTFKGDSAHYRGDETTPGANLEFSYQLDPEKKPKAVDLKLTKCPDKKAIGMIHLGIYALDGDDLKICFGNKERPTEFATKGKEKTTLMVLKRKLVGTGAGSAGPDTAFKRMEQQVLKCKTLQVQLEATLQSDKDTVMSMKGRLAVAQGDKVRLELDGTMKGKPEKMVMVSDGRKLRVTSSSGRLGQGQDQDTKKHLGDAVLASLSRGGVFAALFMVAPEAPDQKDKFDPEKAFPISDLKLGKQEVILGAQAQALEYSITLREAGERWTVTLWVDVKTNLPLKRVVTLKQEQNTITVTESYTRAVVDGKIDEKEFELLK